MQSADPMQPPEQARLDEQGRRLCSAHHKNDGTPCNGPAMAGQDVCRMHGGSSPQAKMKAAERLALAALPSAEFLSRMAEGEVRAPLALRVTAARDILDRTGHARSTKHEIDGSVAVRLEDLARLADDRANRRGDEG